MRRSLAALGNQWVFARRIARHVLPGVASEMRRWEAVASAIPNTELRRQALASLRLKRFHAEGGGVYAAAAPGRSPELVKLIVALQTISDYLDNLCDRSVAMDEHDFRQLHGAMTDAVTPWAGVQDYYRLHPNKDDGGYLNQLVAECQQQTAALPSYIKVQREVVRLVELYSDLQVYKHIQLDRRVPSLESWFLQKHQSRYPDIDWWEFAAATGSTLAVFALFVAATTPDLRDQDVQSTLDAYFPWVCGLHILLDYWIDQAEDKEGGDLNFVSYYPTPERARERLKLFLLESRRRVHDLDQAPFHQLIVHGLPGLYLASSKVRQQRLNTAAWDMIRTGGPLSILAYASCHIRRALRSAHY